MVKKNKKTEHGDQAQTRLLIVEDEPAAREASGLYLCRCGYAVATAANASEALESAEREAPDILVCDWQLGTGGSGVDVARDIQARYGTPVIFISAHPLDELRNATRDLNVVRCMRKPISLKALAGAIAAVA